MMKKYFVLLMVLGLGMGLLSCGQQGGDGTTTTTTSTTTTTAVGANMTCKTQGSYTVVSGSRAASLQAQNTGSITGTVYSVSTSQAMEGVTVWAGVTSVATTDANGQYTITGVSTAEIPVTAIYGDGVYFMTVVTDASNIDFYLFDFSQLIGAGQGSVKCNFTDTSGNTLYTDTGDTTIYAVDSNGFAGSTTTWTGGGTLVCSGETSHVYAGENIVAGVIVDGLGSGYTTEVTVTASATTEVTVPIYQEGTDETFSISGTVSVPSGYDLRTPKVVVLKNNYSGFGIEVTGAYTTGEGTYSVNGFVIGDASDYALLLQAGSSDCKKFTCSMTTDLDFSAGAELSKNVDLAPAPEDISATIQESGGVVVATITWDAPSSWTPTYYLVVPSFSEGNDGFAGFIITDKTSVQVPIPLSSGASLSCATCWAFEAPADIDFSSFNFSNLTFTKLAMLQEY